ncbi:MAG TPA: serine hydrolase domain-containing protein [Longimicrobiales bacterium]|nr:serine hydrolase domain-containing protein [Longimicrobiales bacterium]
MRSSPRALPILLLALAAPAAAQTSHGPDRSRVAAAVDSIVAAALEGGRAAGMSVAVVRGRDTLVLKGYGFADLELDAPTPERAIYEIGSVTKQFTASAILQLQEQGKLSLDDEITKYLPGYPTQGRKVTLRRLLDHTSGIKGYTELPEFERLMSRKMPRDTLVALFSSKPFDFEPGEAEVYNNSAFFLLGLVIEKVSGMSYADYVKKNLFDRAGMPDSRYCSESAMVKRRAHGYDTGPNGLQLAAYIDQTWPFSAGSLCSTAADLAAWTLALHSGKILGPAAYQELITPGTLNDGTRLRYAKGLAVDSLLGHRAIHHGGGIPGFLSELEYFPDDTLVIAVLINSTGPVSPEGVARSIEEAVLGRSVVKAAPFKGKAADYVGEYRGVGRGQETVLKVAQDSTGTLTIQQGRQPPRPLAFRGGDTFEVGNGRYTFKREGKRVVAVRADFVFANTLAKRTP